MSWWSFAGGFVSCLLVMFVAVLFYAAGHASGKKESAK